MIEINPVTLILLALGTIQEDGRVRLTLDEGASFEVESIVRTHPHLNEPLSIDTEFAATYYGTTKTKNFRLDSLQMIERCDGKLFGVI